MSAKIKLVIASNFFSDTMIAIIEEIREIKLISKSKKITSCKYLVSIPVSHPIANKTEIIAKRNKINVPNFRDFELEFFNFKKRKKYVIAKIKKTIRKNIQGAILTLRD